MIRRICFEERVESIEVCGVMGRRRVESRDDALLIAENEAVLRNATRKGGSKGRLRSWKKRAIKWSCLSKSLNQGEACRIEYLKELLDCWVVDG